MENEDESRGRLSIGAPRDHQHEDILRHVQQAADDIRWTVDQSEFGELLALKKDSALGPDGIHYGAYRCAGGLGSNSTSLLVELFWNVVLFQIVLKSRTVFISKTSDRKGCSITRRASSIDIVQLRLRTSYFCHLSGAFTGSL